MHHISIILDSDNALQHFPFSSCPRNAGGMYTCPVCPEPKYTGLSETKNLTEIKLIAHMKSHFDNPSQTLTYKGYKMTACFQSCVRGSKSHFHCPFCNYVSTNKKELKKHVMQCQNSSVQKVDATQNSAKKALIITSTPVPSQQHAAYGGMNKSSNTTPFRTPEAVSLRKSTKDLDSPLGSQFTPVAGFSRNTSRSPRQDIRTKRGSGLNDSFMGFSPFPITPIQNSRETSVMRFCPEKLNFDSCENEDAHLVILEYLNTGDPMKFEKIFKSFSECLNEDAMLMWIKNLTECVHLLDRKADKLVLAYLKLSLFFSQKLASAVNAFIRTLVGHHNYYSYHVLKNLFNHLIPVIKEEDNELLTSAGSLSAEEEAVYDRVLSAIIDINSDIPMTQENLLLLARKSMPYLQQHVHRHAVYARNLLKLAKRLPPLRVAVLEVIIFNMITIDVHAPRSELIEEEDDEEDLDSSDEEDMFDMEVEDSEKEKQTGDSPLDSCQVPCVMTHKVGNKLDVLMSIMLQYVHDVSHGIEKPTIPLHLQRTEVMKEHSKQTQSCQPGRVGSTKFDPKRLGGCECGGAKQDVEALKVLYNDMKLIFSNIILRTHASAHVQFLIFYIISLRPGLLPFFCDFLINTKFKDPNVSLCIRKNAIAYVGSLLARGKFVTFVDLHTCLESIRDWCNDYLDTQERLQERHYEDLSLHGPFYYACQTMLYVFTFRYKEYTENKKALSMARSLNLERFIHSKLNPLNVCSPPVVRNFAAVAHRFQIAYCHTVLENNKRLKIPVANPDAYAEPSTTTLDLFFPFDPYLLQRSKLYIQNHYREFEGLPEDMSDSVMDVENGSLNSIISPDPYDIIYGVSPGFVRFSEDSICN